jgi:hypothetical protein
MLPNTDPHVGTVKEQIDEVTVKNDLEFHQ